MSRSNWGIVAAVVGWLILANAAPAPDNSGSAEQAQLASDAQRSLERIANAQEGIANQAEPEGYQDPCEGGEPNDRSDLCAQWYAAKSARSAADAAWWALLVGIVGAVGIVAALGLTIQSNAIARDTSRRQLRAYVGVASVRLFVTQSRSPFELDTEAEVIITNFGETPAYIADQSYRVRQSESADATVEVRAQQILNPGAKRVQRITIDRPFLMHRELPDLMIFVKIAYRDYLNDARTEDSVWSLKSSGTTINKECSLDFTCMSQRDDVLVSETKAKVLARRAQRERDKPASAKEGE